MMDEMEFERRARAVTQTLFRVCCAILPERADREDAIQNALIKAWRRRDTLRNAAYFETWLVRIAINECKTMLRRRRRAPTVALTDDISAYEANVPDAALSHALRDMDVKLRLPLLLHHGEGYTLDETARLLGIPLGTLKYRLKQGKRVLTAQLEGDE